MPAWSTACPDWEERIVAGRSLIPFGPLFPAEAQAALDIFGELRLVDVAGRPTFAEAARPWVMDFAGAIFGAYDAENVRRLIRNFFLLISKKNGKSTLAAGIMVTALVRNWRESGEYYILAPTKEIADNSYAPARDMIRAHPVLSELLKTQDNFRTITHKTTGAFVKVVASDSETVSGKKTIGLFVDELWLFGKRANAASMLLEAMGGLASRPEGFVIYASTQSDEQPAGVFEQKLREFRAIRDGSRVDPASLPVIYEYPKALVEAEAYKDEATWYVTNPNLGASVNPVYIAERFSEAEQVGRGQLNLVLAKHLNVEIGVNLRLDRWAGAEWWEAAAEPEACAVLADLLARSETAVVGIDGGGLDDLLGLAVVGREKGTGRWLLWTHAWAHPVVLERRKSEAARLLDFAADGDLELVERLGNDIDGVAEICEQVLASGLLPEKSAIGMDPVGVGQIVDALSERGLGDERVVGVSQGWKLAGAIKTAERKLADGTLVHGGQKMMAWCVGNAKVEPRGNAILITKQASGTAKIDPLMATFNAVALMSMNPAGMRSVYEERELLVL